MGKGVSSRMRVERWGPRGSPGVSMSWVCHVVCPLHCLAVLSARSVRPPACGTVSRGGGAAFWGLSLSPYPPQFTPVASLPSSTAPHSIPVSPGASTTPLLCLYPVPQQCVPRSLVPRYPPQPVPLSEMGTAPKRTSRTTQRGQNGSRPGGGEPTDPRPCQEAAPNAL
ncbi:uncharacterized protein LOC122166259 isoform X2 [Centrocercus urophasianus]|uniref:uncharacterized protein LOC122166259 isoform X2 n=1 Tax=Centrocercus urophasianus TaxID=9002 RepID=UPI001C653062|nr:uncharacterized protein LOC122166259 isoform X2 [Centrocercus urophasianus]